MRSFEQITADLSAGLKATLERVAKMNLFGEKVMVPARDGGMVEAYFYAADSDTPHPVVFDMHGGGFVFGDGANEDLLCDYLRNRLNLNIISINYRKAPKFPYPTAVHDVFDTICYFQEHAETFRIDPARMATMGHSAGGNLAAVAAILGKETGAYQLRCQVLNYPYLDVAESAFEKPKFPEALPPLLIAAFAELYCAKEDKTRPTISPACCSIDQLRGLPPAAIITADFDSLRAEGERYAAMLQEAGVPVILKKIEGADHGFLEHYFERGSYEPMPEEPPKKLPPDIRRMIKETVGVFKEIFREYLESDSIPVQNSEFRVQSSDVAQNELGEKEDILSLSDS